MNKDTPIVHNMAGNKLEFKSHCHENNGLRTTDELRQWGIVFRKLSILSAGYGMKSHDKKHDVLSFLVESRDQYCNLFQESEPVYISRKRPTNSHHAQAGLRYGF